MQYMSVRQPRFFHHIDTLQIYSKTFPESGKSLRFSVIVALNLSFIKYIVSRLDKI